MLDAPIVNPHPDPALIDALAGEALERELATLAARCRTCRGAGHLSLGHGRDDARTCPMCRGTGKAIA